MMQIETQPHLMIFKGSVTPCISVLPLMKATVGKDGLQLMQNTRKIRKASVRRVPVLIAEDLMPS